MRIAFYVSTQRSPERELRAVRLSSGDQDQLSGKTEVKVEDPEIHREADERLSRDDGEDIYLGTWNDIRRQWSTWNFESLPGPLQESFIVPRPRV